MGGGDCEWSAVGDGGSSELSLNSVVGLTTPSTMKVRGTVGSKEVVILVDCGATHNFLSLDLIRQLEILTTTTTNYGVIMGTRLSVKGKEICKGIVVEVQELNVVEDFLPLELGNTDVILGMQCLSTLGNIEVNWKLLTMKFRMGKSVRTLKGDPGLHKTGMSLKTMVQDLAT